MNRFHVFTAIALVYLGIALPVYAACEPGRLSAASAARDVLYAAEGAEIYLDNCAGCHGPAGEGAGVMPALDREALAGAEARFLFQVIARAAHGTSMAAWHADAGGVLNDYQIGALVALIRDRSWEESQRRFAAEGDPAQVLEALAVDQPLMAAGGVPGPHDCVSCHEEPEVHAERFGLNCANCHTLQAWQPALLARHTFALNHGVEEDQACTACHLESYVTYTCYECHDHQAADMEAVHLAEGITELDRCADCHPTGAPGEAGSLVDDPWGGLVHGGGEEGSSDGGGGSDGGGVSDGGGGANGGAGGSGGGR